VCVEVLFGELQWLHECLLGKVRVTVRLDLVAVLARVDGPCTGGEQRLDNGLAQREQDQAARWQ